MQRIFLLVIFMPLAGGALGAPATSTGAPAQLDLPGYTAELGRWAESVHRLGQHPEEAAALRNRLPDHWTVAVRDQHFRVSTDWLWVALDRVAANSKLAGDTSRDMSDRLESMRRDSQALEHASQLDSGLARARLEEILKRREFRSVRGPTEAETLWDRLEDWFWKFISGLLSRAGSHPAATRTVLWLVVIALSLVFLGWLIYSVASVSLSNLGARGGPPAAAASAFPQPWRGLVQQARALAARGDYRDAIRSLYGAAVRRIEEAGIWEVDPARTHREYLRLLPDDSALRPSLVAITTCFERVWYGNGQASPVEFESVLTAVESLR